MATLRSIDLHPQVDLYLRHIERDSAESRREAEVRARQALLEELYGDAVQYGYASDGSPRLTNTPELNISLSHSDQWLAFGVSKHIKIGIDIEDFGYQIARVHSRFCIEQEFALAEAARIDPDLFLHLLWSAKESAYKLTATKAASLHAFRLTHIDQQADCRFSLQLTELSSQMPLRVLAHHTPQFALTLALPVG